MSMAELLDTFFNIPILIESFPLLMKGLWITLKLAFLSILFGSILGLVLALMKISPYKYLRPLSIMYIDFFRALPLIVLLVVVYYALPYIGIELSPYAAAILSLSLMSGSYAAEIIRSGIEAIPKGQTEASRSLGFGYIKTMRYIILPQSIKIIIPPFTGNCINVLKDTALASAIALPELLKQAQQVQAWKASPTPLIGVVIIYLLVLLPLIHLSNRLERRMNV
jgi:polar amino acid transport system permease protein